MGNAKKPIFIFFADFCFVWTRKDVLAKFAFFYPVCPYKKFAVLNFKWNVICTDISQTEKSNNKTKD